MRYKVEGATIDATDSTSRGQAWKVPRKWPAIVALVVVIVARLALSEVATPVQAALPVAFVALLLWVVALRAAPQGGRSLFDELQRWRSASQGLDRDDRKRVKRAVKRREEIVPRLARPAAAWAHRRVMSADFAFWMAVAAGATMQTQLVPSVFPLLSYAAMFLVPVAILLASVARRRREDREVLRERREAARTGVSGAPDAASP